MINQTPVTDRLGAMRVAERPVVPGKPGNAGGGKGPQFKINAVRAWRLGNLSTPISVQKLQTALHTKAKSEAQYRFYALYDKIYREDILAYAYAQCLLNAARLTPPPAGWNRPCMTPLYPCRFCRSCKKKSAAISFWIAI